MCKSTRMADLPALLTTAEVADLLGRTIATVNRQAASGVLPVAHKLPTRTGANLFRREDIERIAAEQRAASVAS